MGSRVTVVVYSERDPTTDVRRAFELIDRYESALSDYNEQSEALRLARLHPGTWLDVSPELLDALVCASLAHDASDGRFDITVGPVSHIWRSAQREGRQPTEDELRAACGAVGWRLLELDGGAGRVRFLREGMRLDFGGIGKGLAADRALELLRDAGLPSALVSVGGDIAVGQAPPGSRGWNVAAGDGASTVPIGPLASRGIATSGDEFRFYIDRGERRSHVLDPASSNPVAEGEPVTVIAPSAWRADALATVARVGGRDAAEVAARTLGGAVRAPDTAR